MTSLFSELVAIDQRGNDRFTAQPPGSGFLYGGLSIALTLRAAAATISPPKTPLSLHAMFLAGGLWEGPHELRVQRVNDSRTFASRRVEMWTGERLAVAVDVAFHEPEEGDDWQAPGTPDLEGPEMLEPYTDRMPAAVLEVRPVFPASPLVMDRLHPLWYRTFERLTDPVLQACALAFASDYRVFSSLFPAGSGRGDGLISRTYSHTLFFHRALAGTEWSLIECDPLTVANGRFLSRGTLQAPDGTLLASFDQLGYVRSAP